MAESDLAPDPDVEFAYSYEQYNSQALTRNQRNRARDHLLNMVPEISYPETIADLVNEFGPEAVYSRVNQSNRDQLARQGYSELSGLVAGYEQLEAISEKNKGLKTVDDGGQITLFSGQFVHSDTDLSIKGRGLDFAFRRTYKSQATFSGPLGAQWDHNYNLWLRIEDGGSRIIRSSGQMSEDTYEYDINTGLYSIPNGFFSKLTKEIVMTVGNLKERYILEKVDGTRLIYKEVEGSGGMYKIESMVDRFNNSLAFEYNENEKGRLERIVDTLGKQIRFSYDNHHRITEILDNTGTGRTVAFCYDDNNDLVCVDKLGSQTGEQRPVITYEYSNYDKPVEFLHNLEAIIDGEGSKYIENEYGRTKGLLSFNRVVRQRIGKGERLFEYWNLDSHNSDIDRPAHRTIVKKRNGHIDACEFNYQGLLLEETECIRSVGQLSVPITTRYRYNEDGQMVEMVDPLGNVTTNVYFREWYAFTANNPPDLDTRRQYGNLVKIIKHNKGSNTVIADNFVNIDNDDIVTSFEYNNRFNQVTSQSDPRDPHRKTKFTYSKNRDGQITEDLDGEFLRRVTYPEVTLPDTQKQHNKIEFEYNEHGQIKREKIFRSTAIDNTSVVVAAQASEICTKYYYFGEPLTDEPGVHGDPKRSGYLHVINRDATFDGVQHQCFNIKTTFDVDDRGNWVKVKDGRGNETVRSYDVMDRPVETVFPVNGITQKTRYNKNSMVSLVERNLMHSDGSNKVAATIAIELAYDCTGNLVLKQIGTDKDPQERVMKNEYTSSDMLCMTWDPTGRRVRLLYDERDLLIAQTHGFATPDETTTKYYYDKAGRVVLVENGEGHDSKTRYDEYSRIIAQVDTLDNIRRYEYDKLDSVTRTTFEDSMGILLSKNEYDYDEIGRLVGRTSYMFKEGRDDLAIPVVTHYYYDEGDNVVRLTRDPGGRDLITDYAYDSLGRRIWKRDNLGNEVIYQHDENDNVVRLAEIEKESGESDVECFVTENEFDGLNRLTKTTDNVGNVTTRAYDSQGNLEILTDALKNITQNEYDSFGQRSAEVRGNGATRTTYSYDKAGLLNVVKDDKGNATVYEYDAIGRNVRTTLEDGSTCTREYDKNSNILKETDCNGLVKHYIHDELDRVRNIKIDKSGLAPGLVVLGPADESFDFDGLGRTVRAFNANSNVKISYDSLGNVVSENQNGRVVKSEYDASSFRISLEYSGGRMLKISPDGLNRIQKIETVAQGNNYPGSQPANASVLGNRFVGPDRLSKRSFGTEIESVYSYDGSKRIININTKKEDVDILDIQSLHDAVGDKKLENVISKTNAKGDLIAYDSLRRVIQSTQHVDIPYFSPIGFAPPDSLTSNAAKQDDIDLFFGSLSPANERKYNFKFDALGNRLMKKETGVQDSIYVSDALNRYESVNGLVLGYDKNGNVTTDENFRYLYDHNNRLVKVETHFGHLIAEYEYDVIGRRIKSNSEGIETLYIYDDSNVIEERVDGALTAQYVFGDGFDEVVQMARGGKDYYYLRNSVGNVVALSESLDVLVEEYCYSPFGIVDSASELGNPYLFTGRRYDPETDLMYFRARQYSPTLGRFLQRDPKNYVDGMNLYEYVGNNPINFADPNGSEKVDTKSRLRATIETFRESGLPTKAMSVVLQSDYDIEQSDAQNTSTPLFSWLPTIIKEVNLLPQAIDAGKLVKSLKMPSHRNKTFGAASHEGIHVFINESSHDPEFSKLRERGEKYYSTAIMKDYSVSQDPRRLFSEAAAEYVEFRVEAVAGAQVNLKSLNKSGASGVGYKSKVNEYKKQYKALLSKTPGYEDRGIFRDDWLSKQVRTRTPIYPELKEFLDREFLGGGIARDLESNAELRKLIDSDKMNVANEQEAALRKLIP